ncbi:MAG: hypothetical protein L0Z53_25205 [Acidobacteriales bacterium]|nr:hypothetical protein [Terriglobales bacterium]
MLSCRFLRVGTLVFAAGLASASALAQTTDNSAAQGSGTAQAAQPATTAPAPPQVSYGGTVSNPKTQVVPVGGGTKIHGSTVPAAMMPREESLGDAARRLKKKKYRKYHKKRKAQPAQQQPPYLR